MPRNRLRDPRNVRRVLAQDEVFAKHDPRSGNRGSLLDTGASESLAHTANREGNTDRGISHFAVTKPNAPHPTRVALDQRRRKEGRTDIANGTIAIAAFRRAESQHTAFAICLPPTRKMQAVIPHCAGSAGHRGRTATDKCTQLADGRQVPARAWQVP